MSSRPGGKDLVYDEKLLDVAPEVTRGQRQEGYDADILNPPAPVRSPAPQAFNEREDLESGASNDKHLAAGGYDPVGKPQKKPFWQTPKGLIIIAVVLIVVIAAAVGGGVGGTVGKNKNNLASNSTSSATADSPGGEQPAASSTPLTTTATGGGEVFTRTSRALSSAAGSATTDSGDLPQQTGITAGTQTQSIPVPLPTGTQEGEQLEQIGK